MSEDIYGEAYEAFIDEIYKNGGGEPSAVRAAVDCAVKSLRAELAAYEAQLSEIHVERANLRADMAGLIDNHYAANAERDALRELLREARSFIDGIDPHDCFTFVARIDAALKGDDRD